jgi:hypothetical protein
MKVTATKLIDSGYDPKLVRSIIRRFGEEWPAMFRDVCRGGAAAGWPGFTYYHDTVGFFKRHRKAIVAMVEELADDLGVCPMEMVAGFNCLDDSDKRMLMASIARCLYGGRLTDEDTDVANALAWFALEEVAQRYDDLTERSD